MVHSRMVVLSFIVVHSGLLALSLYMVHSCFMVQSLFMVHSLYMVHSLTMIKSHGHGRVWPQRMEPVAHSDNDPDTSRRVGERGRFSPRISSPVRGCAPVAVFPASSNPCTIWSAGNYSRIPYSAGSLRFYFLPGCGIPAGHSVDLPGLSAAGRVSRTHPSGYSRLSRTIPQSSSIGFSG